MKKICVNCNKEFNASRSDAKYCNTNCKNQYNYKKNATELEITRTEQAQEIAYLKTKEEIIDRDKAIVQSCLQKSIDEYRQLSLAFKNELRMLTEGYFSSQKAVDNYRAAENNLQRYENHNKYLTFWIQADDDLVYNCFLGRHADYLRGLPRPQMDSQYRCLARHEKNSQNVIGAITSQRKEFARRQRMVDKKIQKIQKKIKSGKLYLLINELAVSTYPENKKKLEEKILELSSKLDDLSSDEKVNSVLNYVKENNLVELQPAEQPVKPKLKAVMSANDILDLECETFQLSGELGRFLGKLERQACAITLIGDSGAGKSYFSHDLAHLFDKQGYKVYYFSLEEGIGELTKKKLADKSFSDDFMIAGKGKLPEVRKVSKDYDVIIIDSFGKLDAKADDYDKLRMDFPNTIFISIFQKTTTGSVRGGSAIVFDSSAIINVERRDEQRVAVMQKSRYGTQNWEFSINDKNVIKEE